jgi:hypothetical protein
MQYFIWSGIPTVPMNVTLLGKTSSTRPDSEKARSSIRTTDLNHKTTVTKEMLFKDWIKVI